MQITVQIPNDETVQAVADGISKVLDIEFDERPPHRVITDAIRDGVAQAISQKLSKKWGDDLIGAIADAVAEVMKTRLP
jgi:uncharacterized protein YggE